MTDPLSPRLCPRGIPLTESMAFAADDKLQWLAYVEGYPRTPPRRLLRQTLLPGRRLRFDSAVESRVIEPVPAGSPFLSDTRLRDLLGRAQPFPPPATVAERRPSRLAAALSSLTRMLALAGAAARMRLVDSIKTVREFGDDHAGSLAHKEHL